MQACGRKERREGKDGESLFCYQVRDRRAGGSQEKQTRSELEGGNEGGPESRRVVVRVGGIERAAVNLEKVGRSLREEVRE
eukprot:3110373-Rhodomonas_salina.3